MKLVSYRVGGTDTFGRVEGTRILDLGKRLGGDITGVLTPEGLARARAATGEPEHDMASVELLPVVPRPDKILCAGVNYMTHLIETGRPLPTQPMIFTRCAASQVGAGQSMIRPPESEMFDFEGELAVVIGRPGRRIPKERAFDHVAGYACYNDGSIRDWQRHTVQFTPGKNFWRTGGFGPWLVTADELPNPTEQTLVTRLNGEEMQRAPVSDLIFDIPALIAYCSTFAPLETGDVIVTGTTGGVGAFRTPPVWMKPGDVVEVEVTGVGVLRNTIADEAAALRAAAE